MLTSATEFPVKGTLSRPRFLAEIVGWLRGNSSSSVLDDGGTLDADDLYAHLTSPIGETLKFREVNSENSKFIGFRHDLPDTEGRIWRTEGVLSVGATEGEPGLLRIRSQCIGTDTGAKLELPRKPFLVKALLRQDFGALDGILPTIDKPIYLDETASDLERAVQICIGKATTYLPVVYVSTIKGCPLLSDNDLEHLADRLGGCAHLVVEPSARFSFKLADASGRRNAYMGAIGLALPGRGTVKRLYWESGQSLDDLKNMIVAVARAVATQSRSQGASWSDIQEIALLDARRTASGTTFDAELEELYKDEIQDKERQITDLRKSNEQQQEKILHLEEEIGRSKISAWSAGFSDKLPLELYSGEIIEWLKKAVRPYADRPDTHARGKVVLEAFLQVFARADGLREINDVLNRAAKDSTSELQAFLESKGFTVRAGKHIVLEPPKDLKGVLNITLPRTPSDWRGNQNQKSDIKKALGLS
ncbi:hypothetical protein [Sphingopyxis sp. 550A]